MAITPRPPDAALQAIDAAAGLQARFGDRSPQDVIAGSIEHFGRDGLGAVSSFGADSAVLLHMIAEIDGKLPILFLDTGKHFEETLDYRDALVDDLGLEDVRVVEPHADALRERDPDGLLHGRDADGCCAIRKVEPMARAVAPFRAWLTGRKRFQSAERLALPVYEAVGPRIRINPLASWRAEDIRAYMDAHALRENPLVAYGYLSIGCFPCTQPVRPGEDARSGRWAGRAKTECGIHQAGLESNMAASATENA